MMISSGVLAEAHAPKEMLTYPAPVASGGVIRSQSAVTGLQADGG
jgi:hypothetical protein